MEPVVVQTHILKTGGTALRQLINANYEPGEVVHTETLEVGPAAVAEGADLSSALDRAWREYYLSLPPDERERVRCFCGHQGPFLIDAIEDRPVRAFCMLRDPVDRVVSSYLFMLWSADRLAPTAPVARILGAMRERGWGLGDLYREMGGSSADRAKLAGLDELAVRALLMTFFNGQARHILVTDATVRAMPLDVDGAALADYRDRAHATLSEKYVVGTQDRFSQSVRLFADSFGWRRVFEPRVNVGRLRGGRHEREIDQETLALIRAYNGVDAELHAHHSARLRTLPGVSRLSGLHDSVRRSASRTRARMGLRKRSPRAT